MIVSFPFALFPLLFPIIIVLHRCHRPSHHLPVIRGPSTPSSLFSRHPPSLSWGATALFFSDPMLFPFMSLFCPYNYDGFIFHVLTVPILPPVLPQLSPFAVSSTIAFLPIFMILCLPSSCVAHVTTGSFGLSSSLSF